ncbi:MAG: hypothetical protein HY769_02360 [Candidatus Stahlbacteria bacterium]|nr:hypothetical protein [Candidatus Stahlbacteria bacterium]
MLTYIKSRIRQLTLSVYLGQAVIKIMTAFGVGLFIFLLLDYWLFLTSGIRLLLLAVVCVVGLGISAIYKFNAVRELEQKLPSLKGRLFASLSSYRKENGYSYELIDEIITQTHSLLIATDIRQIVKKHLIPFVKPLIVSLIVVGISLFFIPSPKSIWLKRFVCPNSKFLSLNVYPGDIKLAFGDSVEVKITPNGLIPHKLYLIVNGKSTPLHKRQGMFTTVLEATEDITYYARVGDVASERHKILVLLKPYIKNMELTYIYPQYTKIHPFVSNTPSIDALYGTQIEIRGSAQVSLDSTIVRFKNAKDVYSAVINSSIVVRVRGLLPKRDPAESGTAPTHLNGNNFTARFNVTQTDTYQLLLFASNGLTNASEKWNIRVWEDEFPRVEIVFPGADIELPATMKIPVIAHISDDYGISTTTIVSDRGSWKMSNELGQDTVIVYEWDLSLLSILPGEIVKYWVEVYDNDGIKGPKLTKSAEYRVYFPTVEDIYEQITQEETKSINEFEKVLDELQASSESIEKIASLSTSTMNWKEKQEVKDALAKMKEIETQLKGMQTRLDELYKLMENSLAADRDLVEKIEELQKLYKELNLPQLNEAIRKVEEAINKNPDLLREAIKNLNLTQEEIKKRIERTVAMLKQFKNEQSLKALADKAKELQEWQKDINEKTQEVQPPGDSLSSLSKDEESLRKELNQLAQEMDKLSKDMPSLSKELTKEGEQAQITEKQLSQAAAQLSIGKKPTKLQKQILSQLSTMALNLNSLSQQTAQQQQEEVAREIRRLENELLFLSVEEENIITRKFCEQVRAKEGNSARISSVLSSDKSEVGVGGEGVPALDMAFRQEAIIKGTKTISNQLQALTKMSPFIPQSANKNLDNSLSLMEQAKQRFEENNIQKGVELSQSAMALINKTVMELMEAEKDLEKKMCSGAGIPFLMQQLSSLTENQQSLNQLIQSLLPLNIMPGGLGQQMQVLSAQQQALADKLQQIAQGLKGKVLGDLGGTAGEMEKIAQQLKQGITKEIVNRQNSVLKHLLDSQKSIYTKKQSRRRVSEPGKDFTKLPSPITPELITKRGIAQKDILNKLNNLNSYKQYEPLIRAYYRALSTE